MSPSACHALVLVRCWRLVREFRRARISIAPALLLSRRSARVLRFLVLLVAAVRLALRTALRANLRFGRPPSAPFSRAAAALAALRTLPPCAPSRAAIHAREPNAPSSNAGNHRSASSLGQCSP